MQEQLPTTPQSVTDWNAHVRQVRRDRIRSNIADGMSRQLASLIATIGPLEDGGELLATPEDVRRDYDAYVAEWNRVTALRNAEVQARRNRAEVAEVRAQTCPRCFASHPGEC